MLTKSELIEQLTTGIYEVTFTKINGEKRVMPCTLMQDYMPDGENVVKKTEVDDVDRISVWCTDAKGWRAFKPSTLIDFKSVPLGGRHN